jgi:hypothetical protein
MKLAWGAKVSPEFRKKLIGHCGAMSIDPNFLMACMAWESGESFSPSIRNAAGSGAVGLIQFMPQTARHLGTSTDELADMTAEAQLDFVFKYFAPWSGKLRTLSDVYMAILWPAAVGKPEDHVLFLKGDARRPKLYLQNAGLDGDRDGDIDKAECAAKVRAKLAKGLAAPWVWDDEATATTIVHAGATPPVIRATQSYLNSLIEIGALDGPLLTADGAWGPKTAAKWREVAS